MFDQRATSQELLHQCQKAFRKTMNEKHFGRVVQCIDKEVARGLYKYSPSHWLMKKYGFITFTSTTFLAINYCGFRSFFPLYI